MSSGEARHVPVMLAEVLDALDASRGGVFVDGTFGAGGYTSAILQASEATRVVAIDRDPDALAAGAGLVGSAGGRLVLVQGRFGDLDTLAADAGFEGVDGVVLDIGVSSMQIDEAARGFSFRQDGPLDMRMEREGRSAADIVNEADEAELADIFFHYGEERRARAMARAIVEDRGETPFETTRQLAELAGRVIRSDPGISPATRVFQALRIAVNDELGELVRALHAAERVLKPGGRLVVVTFHSLEDRIAKQFFTARTGRTPAGSRHVPSGPAATPTFRPVVKGALAPSHAEVARNPRARSAKLRAAERTGAPAQEPIGALSMLAELPRTAKPRGGRR
jgi:16S rRNA (cytosine1402-N4)-methyltransferase